MYKLLKKYWKAFFLFFLGVLLLLMFTAKASEPTDFKANEASRRRNTINTITPDIQRIYCLPRIADLAKKKELKLQLEQSTETEDNKTKAIMEDCIGEFIKTFQ